MKKSLVALYALLLTLIGGVPIAYAGCMDDAGDAIGAFFTGGASYAICSMIETVKSIIRVVETLTGSMTRIVNESVDTARQLVHDTANSIDQNTRNAMNQLSNLVNDARRLAAAPPATTTPGVRIGVPITPGVATHKQTGTQTQGAKMVALAPVPMADAAQLQAALRQGADTMARIHSALQSQAVNHILSATQLAKNQAERHLNAARRIGETSVMAPLRQLEQMLNGLLAHPERLFDPTSLVNESIERLTTAMTQVVEQMHHEITNEALATVQGVDQHIRRVTGDTAVASKLHEAMTKAHQRRTQQSLDELRAALRAANGDSASRAAMAVHMPAGIHARVLMPNVQQLRTASLQKARFPFQQHANALKMHAAKFKDMRQQGLAGRLPPGAEQRARAELDRLLKGKTPAEAEQIKRNLKTQMQAKFQKNPKALAEINRRFDDRFSAHLRLNPALLRTAPAGRTGLLLPAVQK